MGEVDEILSHSHTCVLGACDEMRSLVHTLTGYFIVINGFPTWSELRNGENVTDRIGSLCPPSMYCWMIPRL